MKSWLTNCIWETMSTSPGRRLSKSSELLSTFHRFHVFVSNKYPPGKGGWTQIHGDFVASNHRGLQAFAIRSPKIWMKYVKISFLSYYGNEFYCPISVLKVFGTTIMEDLAKTNIGFHPDENEDKVAQQTLTIPQNFMDLANDGASYPSKRYFEFPDSSSESTHDSLPSLLDRVTSPKYSPALKLNQQLEHDFKNLFHGFSSISEDETTDAQESVFKTIIKRLEVLERRSKRDNALIAQVIEEFESDLSIVYEDFNNSMSRLY